MEAQLRRGVCRLQWMLVLASCFCLPALAADAKTATKAVAASTKPVGKAAEKSPQGFSIAAAPAWVRPLQAEAVSGLAAAPLQVLLMDKQTRVETRGGSWRYQHALRQVNDSAGLQKAALLEVEFDPSYQQLVLHQLDVIRDGRRIKRLDASKVKLLHRETQLERQIVDGRMTATIVVEDLRVGDQLEWAASLVGDNPVFGGRFVDQEWLSASLGPIGQVQYRLLAPAGRPIRHRVAEPKVEFAESSQDGWRELRFSRRAVPQFHYDPAISVIEQSRDLVELSEFADWADVAVWAEQLFGRAMQPSALLDERIKAIEAKADTPHERLRLALDFVQQEVRYFGTEMGASSHQPAQTETVLRQRFGDCKDKAALLVSLLQGLGLRATPALVSTQFQKHVAQRLPSPLAFDHAIVNVALDDQQLWLDATRSTQQGAVSGRQSVGLGWGLVASSASHMLSAMPPAREALRSETVDTFHFERLAQPGRMVSVVTYHGDMAEWVRGLRNAMPVEDFQKALQADVLRAYPALQVDGEPLLQDLDDRNALRVTQKFKLGDFWRFPEKRMLGGDLVLYALMSPLRLPDQTPRSQTMRINLPGRYLQRVRFEFGEPAFARDSGQRFDDSNDFFELHLQYKGESRAQQIDGELKLNADEIPAGQWSRYRDQLNKSWARLVAAINVPAVSPAELAALRQSLDQLNEDLRTGRSKARTREQYAALSRIIVDDRMLSADRLPPKLRAQVLLERGMQLDHLAQSGSAKHNFEQALQLDPDNAEIHAAMAVNALLSWQDADAIRHATQALKLAPNDVGSRYTRVFSHFFAERYVDARDELREILQSSSEVERGYGSIWLYLSSRRLGEDGAAALRGMLPSEAKPSWPYPVLQLFQGQLDLEGALAASLDGGKSDAGRECELYFYAAQKALLDKDPAKARTLLRKSIGTGVIEFNEYRMAQRELERLGGH